MESKVYNLEDFNGNSVSGERGINNNGHKNYKIYSYTTLIFEWDFVTCNVEYFNNKSYSPTTSRIQNMLIRWYGLNNGVEKRN